MKTSVIALLCVPVTALAEPVRDDPEEEVEDEVTAEVDEIIVVTGSRTPTPLAASPVVTEVIDRQRLVESGARTAAEALAQRPGIWLERGIGGVGVSMQGLGPAYVLVLVDGRRQIGRTDDTIDLARFGVAGLEQIEIVRGPGSALYGSDALGGVINLVTRAPEEERGELALHADHRGGTDTRLAIGGGRAGWSGNLAGQWRQGPAFDRTPEDVATTIAGHDDAVLGGRGEYRRGEAWRLGLTADYQQRDLTAVEATATGAVLDRRNLIETASTGADLRWFGERTTAAARIGVGLYRDQYASDQRGGAALDQYQDTREHLIELGAQVDRRIGRHRAGAGGELLAEALSSARLADDGGRERGALWVQDEWRPDAAYRWLLVPAVRVDADTQFGWHVTPRLAGRWDPTDTLVVRASLGTGYRAPDFKDLLLRFENPGAGYVVEGNPDLRPETSRSLQGGVEWKPRGWLWVAANGYGNALRDLITAVTIDDGMETGTVRFGYANIGRARTFGGDVAAVVSRGRLGVELGYAWTRARDLDAGAPLEGIPAHRANAALRWRDEAAGLSAVIEVAVTGPRPYARGDGMIETDPRTDLRARIARRFGEHLELAMGADNLLDAGDDTFDRQAPRTFHAALTARR